MKAPIPPRSTLASSNTAYGVWYMVLQHTLCLTLKSIPTNSSSTLPLDLPAVLKSRIINTMAESSHGSSRHPYRDDADLEMTTLNDHEVCEGSDDEDEGQLMLRQGSKKESAKRSSCRKCPYVLLALLLLIVGIVGYVTKNDIDIAMVGKLIHMGNSCPLYVRKVKIESTTRQVVSIAEMQLLSSGVNVAKDGKARQSSTHKAFAAASAIDGDLSTFSHTDGHDHHAWWELDLQEVKALDHMTIYNRWCEGRRDHPGCLCRLTDAKLSFMDDDGVVISTRSLGVTCNAAEMDLDLSSCEDTLLKYSNSEMVTNIMVETSSEPTYFPTKEPTTPEPPLLTSTPTYEPTAGHYNHHKSDLRTSSPTYYPTTEQPTLSGDEIGTVDNFDSDSSMRDMQISNYVAGEAIILNIHITHHAGTSVCGKMSNCGPTPSFACMKRRQGDDTPWPENDPKLERFGLAHSDAKVLVDVFRPYFHFMSMEYPRWGNLHYMNWEYPDLVSMIVMRHPLDRFLAGGKCGGYHNTIINEADPNPDNEEVQKLYWSYANDKCADNYALRVLADRPSCDVSNMKKCYESAQRLLERFTFILDEDCLDESMEAMGNELGLHITADGFGKSLRI